MAANSVLRANFRPVKEIREIFACEIWNPGFWNPESGIALTIGIQNPSSTDKYWNPVESQSSITTSKSRPHVSKYS